MGPRIVIRESLIKIHGFIDHAGPFNLNTNGRDYILAIFIKVNGEDLHIRCEKVKALTNLYRSHVISISNVYHLGF